jgi:hypothetical protein
MVDWKDFYSKEELYQRYDLIVNQLVRNVYFNVKNNNKKLVLKRRGYYEGYNLFFEIAKIIKGLDNTIEFIVDCNIFTYMYLKLKNKNLNIKRNKEKLPCLDFTEEVQKIHRGFYLPDTVLEDIYEAYYKKGAVIEE